MLLFFYAGNQLDKPSSESMVRVTSFTQIQDAATSSLTSQLSTTSAASEDYDSATIPLMVETTSDDNNHRPRVRLRSSVASCLGHRGRGRKNKQCLCFFALSLIASVLIAALLGALCVWLGVYNIRYVNSSQSVFATRDTVVIVAEFSDPLDLSATSIHECPIPGKDFPHTNHLFIVPQDQLSRNFRNISKPSKRIFNQTSPQCYINLLDNDFYLLSGSEIHFSICVTTPGDFELSGTLLIFDNNEDFSKYHDCDDTEDAALVHHLFIGRNGRFMCTNISYTSSINGYHYIIANTPGNILFQYHYTYQQYYLNKDDFSDSAKCSVSVNGVNKCDLGDVARTPVVLVVYVEKNLLVNSFSTHLCLESSWSDLLIGLLAGLGIVCVVFCVVAVYFSVCLCRVCCC